MRTYLQIIFILLSFLSFNKVHGQTTYTASVNYPSYTNCSFNDIDCSNYWGSNNRIYLGGIVKITVTSIVGNQINLRVKKCDNTAFLNDGHVNFREFICDDPSLSYNTSIVNFYSGDTEVNAILYTNNNFTSGTAIIQCAMQSGYSAYPTFLYSKTITITATTNVGTCADPTNLLESNITATSATMNWSAINPSCSIDGYDVYLYQGTSASGGSIDSWTDYSGTSITKSGLLPNTTYTWKVRQDCDCNGLDESNYITSTFTTSGNSNLDCSNAISINCGQTYNGTTSNGSSNVAMYNCSTWDESGFEKVHTVSVSNSGTLTASLSNLGNNDLDVFILDACGVNACLDAGDNTASATVTSGTYYIVVDGYQGASGSYTLNVSCPVSTTPFDLQVSNSIILPTGNWTQTTTTKDVQISIENNGGQTFNGTIYLSWHDANGNFITDLDQYTGNLSPNNQITLTPNPNPSPVASPPGNYQIIAKYTTDNITYHNIQTWPKTIVGNTTTCYTQQNTSGLPTLTYPLEDGQNNYYVIGVGDFGDDWSWGNCGGQDKKHVGIDIFSNGSATNIIGDKVYAAYSGTIEKVYTASANNNWGDGVVISHNHNGLAFTTTYIHLNVSVAEGNYVQAGDEIGTIVSINGNSTGSNSHLHFGVRKQAYSTNSVIARRGALPRVNQSNCSCGGDPVFPEYWIDPDLLSYINNNNTITAPTITFPTNFYAYNSVPSSINFTWNKNNIGKHYNIKVRKFLTGTTPNNNHPFAYTGDLGDVSLETVYSSWFSNNGISLEQGYSYRFVVIAFDPNNPTNTATSTDFIFSIDLPQAITQLTVQGITIRANNITQSGNIHTASGNVTIEKNGCNSVLVFNNDLTIDLSSAFNQTISGTGRIYVTNVPSRGTFDLYDGFFTFKVNNTTLENSSNGLLATAQRVALALLGVELESIDVDCDYVDLHGEIELPNIFEDFGGDEIEYEVDGLRVSKITGIDWSGGIEIDNDIELRFLEIDDLSLNYDGINDAFSGSVELETTLLDLELATEITQGSLNYLKIDAISNTHFYPLGTTGLSLVGGGFEFGNLNNPPMYLQLNANLEPTLCQANLPPNSSISKICDILGMSVYGNYNFGGTMTLGGNLELFDYTVLNPTFSVGNGQLNIGATLDLVALYGYGNIGFSRNPFKATSVLTLNVQQPTDYPDDTPPWLENGIDLYFTAGFPQPSAGAFLYLSPYENKYYLAAAADFDTQLFSEFYYVLTWQNGLPKHTYGKNYNILPIESQNYIPNPNQNRIAQQPVLTNTNLITSNRNNKNVWNSQSFNTGILQSYFLNESTKNLVIEIKSGHSNYADACIYSPSGDTITKNNYSNFDNVTYGEISNSNMSVFSITNPIIGDYLVASSNTNDTVKLYRANNRPYIQIKNVTHNSTNKTLTINWIDSDPDENATISFGVDNDSEGANGEIFISGITENGTNSFTWNYDTINNGQYYIYAFIQDSIGQFFHSYSREDYSLIQSNPIQAPSNLSISPTDTSITLSWVTNHIDTFYNNVIYYAYEPNTVSIYSNSIGVGLNSTYEIKELAPKGYIEFLVTTIDSNNVQSIPSSIISTNWISNTLNHSPKFANQFPLDVAYVGTNYSYQCQAIDLDNDPLTYSLDYYPTGLTINNNGLITWNPNNTNAGIHTIQVKVTDNNGGIDSMLYVLNTMTNNTAIGNLNFSKALYSTYQDKGIISLYNRDFNGNYESVDTVSCLLYSDTDTIGTMINLIETGFNSRQFVGDFALSSTQTSGNIIKATPGDKLWIVYQDNFPQVAVKEYAYFTEYNANFEVIDSLCSGSTFDFKNTSTGDGMSFIWNFGNGTTSTEKHPSHQFFANQTGDGYQQYTVTLQTIDERGNVLITSQVINVGKLPQSLLPSIIAECDTAILIPSIPTNNILWSNSDTSNQLVVTTPNTFIARIENQINQCHSYDTVTVNILNDIAINYTQIDVTCHSFSDAEIDVTTTGSSAHSFTWNNNSTTEDQTNLPVGTYDVTVTDANGCQKTESITITEPIDLQLTTQHTDNSCFGDTQGSITTTVTGGTSGYTRIWENGTSTINRNNLSAGNYAVTATDANGCTKVENIIITEPSEVILSTTQIDVDCYNNATASIDLQAIGGVGNFGYVWNNNATSQDLSNLTAGTYNVTVTDGNGCIKNKQVVVTEPTEVILSTTHTNLDCFGDMDGTIDLTVSGGVSTYNYAWNNNSTNEDLSNLSVGTYSVLVTDANGCQKTDTITLTEPQQLQMTEVITSPLCYDSDNGSIDITSTGGVPNYTFAWNYNNNNEDATSLVAGNYAVTLTDGNNCILTKNFTVTAPQPITTITQEVAANCFGETNGSSEITASGGTTPFTYNWNNNTTNEDLNNVGAGTYTVIITDNHNCKDTTTVIITEPNVLDVTTTNTNLLCDYINDGTITTNIQGGTQGYTQIWNTGATTQNLQNLGIGTYEIIVIDANGCLDSATVTIHDTLALTHTSTTIDADCNTSTGELEVSPSGGAMPYNYQWSSNANNATTSHIDSLYADNYTVIITDNNGCVRLDTLNISFSNIPISNATVTPSICPNDSIGSIFLSMSSGTPPYTADWSNGATTLNIINLDGGIYHVTITDANDCITKDSFIVHEADEFNMNFIAQDDDCATGSGSINMGISGGTLPYILNWNHGANTNFIDNLSAGNYQLTVTDANGCNAESPIISIETTNVPTASFTSFVNDSLVYLDANSSTNINQYTWDFGNGQTAVGSQHQIVYNNSGVYTVTLTGTNTNCNLSDVITQTISINLTNIKNQIQFESFTLAPNPNNGDFYLDFQGFEQGDYSIEIYNTISQLVHNENIDIIGNQRKNFNLSLPQGVYHLKIRQNNTSNQPLYQSFIIR